MEEQAEEFSPKLTPASSLDSPLRRAATITYIATAAGLTAAAIALLV